MLTFFQASLGGGVFLQFWGLKWLLYRQVNIFCVLFSQAPFNTITLSAVGDDAAPSFFEVMQDGRIKVKSGANLASDTETDYRVCN